MTSRKRRRLHVSRLAFGGVAVLAVALLALGAWEAFFLRLSSLRDPREVRTLEVPKPGGTRELVVGPRNPYWTPLSAVSPTLLLCVVRAEDSKFYQHEGFDWDQMQDSLETNLEKGRYKRGGSTITMQLAKNLYLNPSKNPLRKIREIIIAWQLEQALSKRRIFEIYLNVIEWG